MCHLSPVTPSTMAGLYCLVRVIITRPRVVFGRRGEKRGQGRPLVRR